MNSVVVLTVAIICFISALAAAKKNKTVPELIRERGYPCEIHHVTTQDGYILTLHRIPHSKVSSHKSIDGKYNWWRNKVPVVLQHGLLSSSGSWVLSTPHKAPAYIFSDEGYDVWMPNIRGSSYSKNHTNLSTTSKEFWDFSWDEMAYYDFPAFIDYILKETGQTQVFYVGHSMGTTIFFSALSRRPDYNSKIKRMYALAPVANVSHVESYVAEFAHVGNYIEDVMEWTSTYEFLPQDSMMMRLVHLTCTILHLTAYLCENMLFLITGFDKGQFNPDWLGDVTDELLSGTSIHTVLHYSQEYLAEKFQRFDYGYYENFKRYGQYEPPIYSMENVTTVVNAMWGLNDYLSDIKDVNKLLPNIVNRGRIIVTVNDPNFNHLDFLWAPEAKELVYDVVIKDMGDDSWYNTS